VEWSFMGLLRRIKTSRTVRVLQRSSDAEALILARDRLIEAGPEVVPELLPLLEDPAARDRAADVLAALVSDDSLPRFVEALGDERDAVADGILKVLSASNRGKVVGLLTHLSDSRVRRRIEAILEARAEHIPAADLARELHRADKAARPILVRLLERHGDATMVPALRELVRHEEWWVRQNAVALLGQFGSTDETPTILPLLEDPIPGVRHAAIHAVAELAVPGALAPLCRALRDPDLEVHGAAIDALVALNDPAAVPHLLSILVDESEYTRRGAVEVLNHVATVDAIADLVKALGDEDWWVRVRAADALGSLGGPKVVEAVISLFDRDDAGVRRVAVEILVAVPDPRSVDVLIRALDDPDWWVRERAVDALARIGEPRAIEAVRAVMARDPELAPICEQALGLAAKPGSSSLVIAPGAEGLSLELSGSLGAAVSSTRVSSTPGRGSEPSVPMSVNPVRHVGPPSPPPRGDTVEVPTAPPAPFLLLERLEPGTVLLGRFEVIRKVGAGGYGVVYLVRDGAVDEDVILKILNPSLVPDEKANERFVREIRLARRISHPNVIRIHDLVTLDRGLGISMEYFPSSDLAGVLEKDGRLPVPRAIGLLQQIAAGLAAAHAQGIVHRDIKPANVLVGEGDVVKLVDFGLASTGRNVDNRLTASGIIVGSPSYMAPEQIRGEAIDARTDLYSLGIVLYEILCGKKPVEGDTVMKVLFNHLEGKRVPLTERAPELPPELIALVTSLMAIKPDDRPESVDAILDPLNRLAA
jgi:serine/threonine-protein kinase